LPIVIPAQIDLLGEIHDKAHPAAHALYPVPVALSMPTVTVLSEIEVRVNALTKHCLT